MKFKLNYSRMRILPKDNEVKWYTASVGKLITAHVWGSDLWQYEVVFIGGKIKGRRMYSSLELAREVAIACAWRLLTEALADLESEERSEDDEIVLVEAEAR